MRRDLLRFIRLRPIEPPWPPWRRFPGESVLAKVIWWIVMGFFPVAVVVWLFG